MAVSIVRIISYLVEIYGWVLVIYCITTWILDAHHPVRRFLWRVVSPLMRPVEKLLDRLIRNPRILSQVKMFTPIILMMILRLLMHILWQLVR